MARHKVFIRLSEAQAEYLADAIESDLDLGHLTPEGRERAARVLAKVEEALSRVACGPDCKCRNTPSDHRANARYRARLTASLTEGN
jgi:hypothetical protein